MGSLGCLGWGLAASCLFSCSSSSSSSTSFSSFSLTLSVSFSLSGDSKSAEGRTDRQSAERAASLVTQVEALLLVGVPEQPLQLGSLLGDAARHLVGVGDGEPRVLRQLVVQAGQGAALQVHTHAGIGTDTISSIDE